MGWHSTIANRVTDNITKASSNRFIAFVYPKHTIGPDVEVSIHPTYATKAYTSTLLGARMEITSLRAGGHFLLHLELDFEQ